MPLKSGSSPAVVSQNIRELHSGKTYAHTAGKFGKTDANRQAIAIALDTARRAKAKGRAKGGSVRGYDAGGGVDPVSAVINALSAGSSASGMGTGAIGAGNPAAPSSATQTQATNAATGVAPVTPAPTSATPMATNTAAATTQPVGTNPGVVAAPNAPMQTKLMARGGVLERAPGGMTGAVGDFNMAHAPNMRPSWEERQSARGLHVGPIMSAVPGRTDRHNIQVPSGSYVIPSAHVSSIGQGNTLAGFNVLGRMFGGSPYGAGSMGIRHGAGAPRPPKAMLANGGYSEGGARGDGDHVPVPVVVAGGEYVIAPWEVRRIGGGSLKNGHRILDAWVLHARQKEIKTQKALPPPAKR